MEGLASRRRSRAASSSSLHLDPCGSISLIPLSGWGLWLADTTAPQAASSSRARKATPGVGMTPAWRTRAPPAARPSASQRQISGVLSRVSPPRTTTGAFPAFSCSVAARWEARAVTVARSRGGSPARPRTPSVPKRCRVGLEVTSGVSAPPAGRRRQSLHRSCLQAGAAAPGRSPRMAVRPGSGDWGTPPPPVARRSRRARSG